MKLFHKRLHRPREPRAEVSTARQIVYGVLSIVVVVLVGVLLWYLTRLPSVTIEEVVVSGGETISYEMVRGLVENELVGSYYLLVPKRFSYTYPHDQVVDALNDIPRLHDPQLVLERRKTLRVTFEEYEPYALWCERDDETAPCYFLSREGYAFAPAPPLRGGALIRHVTEGGPELGEQQVFNTSELSLVDDFVGVLTTDLGFRVRSVVHTAESDLVYHLNGGGDLLVASGVGAQESFENLKSVLESEEFAHLAPGNFNYIDLRFGNKVFVNEELNSTTTPSSEEEQY